MGNDYYKIGKLYNLTSATTVPITGGSLIHAIYNGANAALTITIDNTFPVHVPVDGFISFPAPIGFTGVKTTSATATGIILYS
jgi:hypothetical protein